ncbi:Domain of unknown function DUF2407 N-terminal [Phaffia rhodozyma]|uniref:Uncharacterized protein n=1 Tax=Phaffia rhodozyma TaxID=264483 RepID=A0A0F7SEU0_PHARH|nr:Domain of unknown function DUF2407 N-terminal [Phaffia rhodozyma]
MPYPSDNNNDIEPLLPKQPSVSSSAGPSFRPPVRSEVSKGKQRARPSPSEESGAGNTSAGTTRPLSTGIIRIRFTEIADEANQGVSIDSGDLDISVAACLLIRSSRPHLMNRRLRLIYSGRVLNPLIVVLPWLRLLSEKTKASVHQSTTTLRSAFEDLSASELDKGGGGRREEEDEIYWIHCSVGLSFEQSEEEEDKRSLTEPAEESQTTPPLRGFDLLRTTAGLSEADIAIMRQQFHGVTSEAELDENAERLEDQWIAGGGAGSLDDGLFSAMTFVIIELLF